MSIALVGTGASHEFRWRRWALLRDAVLAHLDRDGSRFRRFYSIGDALGQDVVRIPASDLMREIEELERGLADHSIDELVLGPFTAAAIYPGAVLKEARPLTPHEMQNIAPVGEEKTLAAYFSSLLSSIREVCQHPRPDGTIEAFDG
jgi:hypothetical protein